MNNATDRSENDAICFSAGPDMSYYGWKASLMIVLFSANYSDVSEAVYGGEAAA